MRVAALDLGSNTSLLLIAEVNESQITKVVIDETRITKLGQGVHASRRFHPDALARMRECLVDYSQKIKAQGCEKVIAVATSAARDVTNGNELVDMGRELGIPVHIIEGAREAALTFRGALSDRTSVEGCAVVDVGGGSTEIIFQGADGLKGQSIDVGSVRLTEMYIKAHPIDRTAMTKISQYVQTEFAKVKLSGTIITDLVAVAGTPTTLAALEQQRDFEENLINGYKLSVDRIQNWIGRLAKMTIEEREKLPGMQPKRSDVIVTGALILAGAVRALGQSEITVSTRGVRYGVALAWQDF